MKDIDKKCSPIAKSSKIYKEIRFHLPDKITPEIPTCVLDFIGHVITYPYSN